MKRISKVNYHVVICGENKVLHRHVNQLVTRVPNLGVQGEDTEPAADIETYQGEDLRRSRRERERPAWTKDYHME